MSDWHYPRDNSDMENLPAPGQIVVLFYEGDDGIAKGPVIGHDIHTKLNAEFLYRRCLRWHAIPEE